MVEASVLVAQALKEKLIFFNCVTAKDKLQDYSQVR